MSREIVARIGIIQPYRLFQYAVINILTQCVGGAVRVARVADSLDALELDDLDVVLVDLDPARLDPCEVARLVGRRSSARVVAFAQCPQSVNERDAPPSLIAILRKDVDRQTFAAQLVAAIDGRARPGIEAGHEAERGAVAFTG